MALIRGVAAGLLVLLSEAGVALSVYLIIDCIRRKKWR